jgi:hypothetical protein
MKQKRGIPTDLPGDGGRLVGDGGSQDEQGLVEERPPGASAPPGDDQATGDSSAGQRSANRGVEVEPQHEDPTDEPH